MKKQDTKLILGALILASAITMAGYLVYLGFYYPYFIQPKEDHEFLSKHPTRAEVLAWFVHKPEEPLKPGERFQMTGWQPLPTRAATHYACCFDRKNGDKIYIFFDAEDRVEEFVIATS